MKKTFKRRFIAYFLLAVISIAALSVWKDYMADKKRGTTSPRDYEAIAAEGIIRVTTEYNSTGFYITGDTVSGFHYELMEAFAREKGLKVEYTPEMSFDQRMRNLSKGKCDIIAHGLAATGDLKDSLLLTIPIILSKSVLIQRKAEESPARHIKSLLDLGGETIHIVKGSPAIMRIRNLESEIGDTIYIKEVDKYGSEQLMAMTSHGDIDYTVCDEHVARALADSLPNLDISTEISFTQFYSWGVSKQSPALMDSLNTFLSKFRKDKQYKRIYRKYYPD